MKKLSIFIIFITSLFIFISCIPNNPNTDSISIQLTNDFETVIPYFIAYRNSATEEWIKLDSNDGTN